MSDVAKDVPKGWGKNEADKWSTAMGTGYQQAWMEEWSRHLDSMKSWYDSPQYKASKAESDRRWKAKPWYERAWIRTTVKVSDWRVRLGEVIAGRSFDD